MRLKEDYSISTFAMIHHPLKSAIDHLIHQGWRQIEIMCEDGHRALLEWSDGQLAELKELGVRHGVTWTLHAPIYSVNPVAADSGKRLSSKDVLHRAMDIAEYLNCKYVVLHAGMEVGPTDGDGALSRCASFLTDVLSERERSSSLVLALENVPPKDKLHGVSVTFVRTVVERVGDPRMRILFDAGHAHVLGPDACLKGLQQCLPYLVSMHLNDNRGDYDSHLAIGMGTIPYPRLIQMVHSYGYQGSWVLETETTAYADISVQRLTEWHDRLMT